MAYLIGAALAVAMCAMARLAGFDRERVFYPTILIVIASYYVLFAAMGGDGRVLLIESLIAAAFLAAAVAAFKFRLWIIVTALVGHGIFDGLHPLFFQNAGIPGWWPAFCLAFDIAAAALLGLLLLGRSGQAFDRP